MEWFETASKVMTLLFFWIGLVFWCLFWIGIMRNTTQSLIALDQWLATVFLNDSHADETISAWTHRKQHRRAERFINWLFRDPNHCAMAYVSEMRGYQNASEYKNG